MPNAAGRASSKPARTRPRHVPHVSVPPGAIPADQWEWRKNFRVWQANRKVFLYPESYLDPDLLDIKTPLFEDLEDDLLQQKITMDSASDAYLRYLTQFAELAHLRIAGSCYHPRDRPRRTYYFFGCTHQDPPVYYWRSWDRTTWSPWRKIDLAIDAPTVSAEFHLGRLYLFWVDTKCKDKTSIKDGNSQLEYYEVTISLQYSALQPNGKWLPAQKLDSLRPVQTAPGVWNNRLYPPTDIVTMFTETRGPCPGGRADLRHRPDHAPPGADGGHEDLPAGVPRPGQETRWCCATSTATCPHRPSPTVSWTCSITSSAPAATAIPGLPAAPAVLLFPEGQHGQAGRHHGRLSQRAGIRPRPRAASADDPESPAEGPAAHLHHREVSPSPSRHRRSAR